MDPLTKKNAQDPQIVEDESGDDVGYVEDDSSPSGCDLHGTLIESGPDGLSLDIFVECNPYYFDKGDPDPTHEENPRTDRPDTQLEQFSKSVANQT